MAQVDAANAQRKEDLHKKQTEETNEKRKRKAKAEQELQQWKSERANQIKQRNTNNAIEEK